MANNNKILFIFAGVILVVSFILVLNNRASQDQQVIDDSNNFQEKGTTQQITQSEEEVLPVAVQFESSSISMDVNDIQEASVLIGQSEDVPVAYYLHLSFDPEIITVRSITVGQIWADHNVLQEEVDNETGEIIVSVGQGFQTDMTGDYSLMTIEFEAIGENTSERTAINVVEDSMIYYTGLNKGIPLTSRPLDIEIN